MDLGIEVILQMFSEHGLQQIFEYANLRNAITSHNAKLIYQNCDAYITTIDKTIAFLQGSKLILGKTIVKRNYLPEAARFSNINKTVISTLQNQDKAKYFATLYLEDLCDFITECVDSDFGFSRYVERIGRSANSFDELYDKLQTSPTLIDDITVGILNKRINEVAPKLIAFSVPFPGNLYSAFRCAQFIKQNYPDIKIVMGGGFPNTELRSLSDVRVFEFFDFITLDDGELPLELIIDNIKNNPSKEEYKRTFLLENSKAIFKNTSNRTDYKQNELGTSDYSDLHLDKYISVIEIANPMHSLWNNGRWNKLTMAHGCYWAKCTFCDCSLDYIKRYEANSAELLVDKMEQIIEQTNERGFHFVDEAAPPNLMRDLAIEIIRRKLKVTWWTNVRFEKSFTLDLCRLLKTSGCIAVSGGLEVASNRLLKLINKGVNVEQVAQVTHNLTQSGIMVHAYLMYGFPTQTKQELIDSLEMVRQMFQQGLIQSAFWHQFALTVHSKVYKDSEKYEITPQNTNITFANNDVAYTDNTGINYAEFDYGLKKALYNYMYNIGFNEKLNFWFNFKIPNTQVNPVFISQVIDQNLSFKIKNDAKVFWLGNLLSTEVIKKSKKGRSWEMLNISIESINEPIRISVNRAEGEWLLEQLNHLYIQNNPSLKLAELKSDFENNFSDFELFWFSKPISKLKANGLICL